MLHSVASKEKKVWNIVNFKMPIKKKDTIYIYKVNSFSQSREMTAAPLNRIGLQRKKKILLSSTFDTIKVP